MFLRGCATSGRKEKHLLLLMTPCLILAGTALGINMYLAYYQSRALWVMPYKWYDLPLAVTRRYTEMTGIVLPMSNQPSWSHATHNSTPLPDELVAPHVDWDSTCPSRRHAHIDSTGGANQESAVCKQNQA